MSKKKIVWAFDPYTDIIETWKRSEEVLNLINTKNSFEIEPVYVLGSDMLRWVGNVTPTQINHIKPYIEKTLATRLNEIHIKGLKSPEIIESINPSRRKDTEAFVDYVKAQKPDLIVINTHARSGIARWFIGSFAESVLLHCEIPTLFINPGMEKVTKLEHVLFPTDFSEHSGEVYKTLLNTYGDCIQRVTILSKILRPINAFAEAGVTALGGAWVAPEQYIDQEKKNRTEDADEWVMLAEKKGIKAELYVDDSLGDVVDSINEFEQKCGADLVAMSSESGPVEAVVIGSIARGVIRSAIKPVIICHGFAQGE